MSSDSKSGLSVETMKILFCMIISLFLLLPQGVLSESAAPQSASFAFRSLDGKMVSSQSLRGEVVVLAVGASWLPLSRKQAASLNTFASEYSRKGVVVFWVSTDSEMS